MAQTLWTAWVIVAVLFLSSGLGRQELHAQRNAFKVIVNESNSTESLSREEVSRFFLKKSSEWKHGFRVSPVDLVADSAVRAAFSESIHGRKTEWIQSYWQKLIFSGRKTPPPELRSDSEVQDFVRHNVGAIGYVSAQAALGAGLKELRVRE